MTHLPATVDELRGRRAARWIRESTRGQYDRYGPDVQRAQIAGAIERLGLVDTELEWTPAHSGSTVHSSPAMREMLDAARAGSFDVLVVARSDRWQRNLRQTLNLLEEELHPAGVVVWFDDEELLSSNEPDPARLERVRQVFDLAAARLTDPRSRHRDRAVLVPQRRRDGRRSIDPVRRGPYALSMLRCASCSRRLIGDTGRYRHTDPCAAFTSAVHQPKRRRRGQHERIPGQSYAATAYEQLVAEVLERVSLGADLVSDVIGDTRAGEPDRIALARIERDRDAALGRYRRTRDAGELERTMARLDAEAAIAADVDVVEPLPADEAVAYLRDLPRLWVDAPGSRRALAEALFESIEVLGLRTMRIHPTAAAVDRGLADAFYARSGGYGRGERSGRQANQLIVRVVPGIPTRITLVLPPRRLVDVAARRSA